MGEEDAGPSWLSDTPAPAPAAIPVSTPAPAPPAPLMASNDDASTLSPRPTPPPNPTALVTTSTEDDDKKLKAIITSMRLLNLGVAVTIMVHAIISILRVPPIGQFVLAFYAVCAGCLICCLETQLKFIRTSIAINFGFLFDPALRFLYYIILASLEWSFGNLFGKIVAAVIVGAALYNTFVMYKYPKYRKKRDELAKEEDGRIQQKIQKRVAKEAGNAVLSSVWNTD